MNKIKKAWLANILVITIISITMEFIVLKL